MKRKFWAVLMTVTMVMVGGCGNQIETNENTKDAIVNNDVNTVEANEMELSEANTTEVVSTDVNAIQEFDPVITEKDDSELHLKNYHDYLEDKTLCTDEDVFSNGAFESVEDVYFQTTKKVPMYASNGVRTGYIDEDVGFSVIATCGDWCYFYIGMDNAKRYARLSEIEENSMTLEEIDAMRAEAEVQAKVDAEAEKQQSTQSLIFKIIMIVFQMQLRIIFFCNSRTKLLCCIYISRYLRSHIFLGCFSIIRFCNFCIGFSNNTFCIIIGFSLISASANHYHSYSH